MPYDLYGTHYKSSREAEAAELSQMSEIDNRINSKRIRDLERQHQQEHYPNQELWQHIYMLEERIAALEKQLPK